MNMIELIENKKNRKLLSKDEIRFFVEESVNGNIPDYQISAFFMAVYFCGMNEEETEYLTESMIQSGDTVDLSMIPGKKVDKHSTGGVGDTTTLITAPLVASLGLPVAKFSGRGLGHTGGTLDKLESIPDMNIQLSIDQFINNVLHQKISVAGQTEKIVPADKLFYALRDVSGTIDIIPLIASSIMSKKIASGSDAIVLDVKTGNGAFMNRIEKSKELAEMMVGLGLRMNRKTVALISDMNQPLGNYIGNSLEVIEAVRILKGEIDGDLKKISLLLGSMMLKAGEITNDIDEGLKLLQQQIDNGQGIEKFRQLILSQNGNPHVIDHPELFPQAGIKKEIFLNKEGNIQSMDTLQIGRSAMLLGAGRKKKNDVIDLSVGIVMKKRLGDYIDSEEPIAEFYANDPNKLREAEKLFKDQFILSSSPVEKSPLTYYLVDEKGSHHYEIR